jgi:pimeloyl-ACP methyl ester carboxylesterase
MTIAKINNVDLFVQVTGHGRPLVMVHGSWGDHTNWDAVVPALSAHFEVITYDRRGHSASATASGRSTTDDDVADLAALIEHVDAGPAHVVGNSFGASISLRLAATRPQLTRSVALHEPPLFSLLNSADGEPQDGTHTTESVTAKILDRIRLGRDREAARLFVEEIALGPGAWDGLPARTRAIFEHNAPTWAEEQADPSWDVIDLAALASTAMPPLRLSLGTKSPPALQSIARRLATLIPRVDFVEFPGAGHIPHVTHPEMYTDLLVRYLASVG